jgi:tRNA A-37 threonylcarbamoyl transferase component Bud32
LCLACYARYGAMAGAGMAAGHPRAAVAGGLAQGELVTRISPAQLQPVMGFVAPEPEEIAPYFPQFEIMDILGRGGMGVVYKARQRDLDRIAALKVLFPEASNDATFGERFLREAKALARLSHPHIVAVHDFGRSAGLCYLVMEFADGPSLRQILAAQPMPLPQAIEVLIQVCDALAYAHAQHIVHRDVKPDNILVDRRAGVKLVDFGIAKLAGRATLETALTVSRQVMGTFFYIAPEQFERPREVDQRADIYALGVVLYEVLTNELPMGRFALPSKRAGTDPQLDRIVMQALEKQPDSRYQRVIEMKEDLERYLAPPGARTVEILAHTKSEAPAPAPVAVVPPAQFVRGPAIALLIAGAASSIGLIVFIGIWLGVGLSQTVQGGAGLVGAFWKNWWQMMAGTAVGPLLISAGRRLERLDSYHFVFAISVLAMVAPVVFPSPFNLLSLPVGVWCLSTLCRREIKAAFHPALPIDWVERALIVMLTLLITLVACVLICASGS